VNLLQNNYYGWKAYVDGNPTGIFQGNFGFISILVPSGEHEVVFSYDPYGVKAGFWVSLVSLLAGLIFVVVMKLKGVHFRRP
jgi:uncharacterized membrane protein YfhO